MNYPREVQERVDVLATYKEVDNLETFDIFHLYPEELCFPNGYYDSRWFKLVGYNTDLMQKQNLDRHDTINIDEGAEVKMCRIFADGSTLIRFRYPIEIINTQAIYVIKRAI